MKKTAKKLIRPKELSRILSIKLNTVSKYVRQGLLKCDKRDDKLNCYFDKDRALKRLKEIKRLENQGSSLSEMKEYFNKKDFQMPKIIVKKMTKKREEQIRREIGNLNND